MATAVVLEIGTKRVFATALEWPGWCRSGKDEQQALAALADYLPRFAPVVAAAGLRLPARAGDEFDVVERLPGSASTDFGVPGAVAERERAPVSGSAGARLAALVTASWEFLDAVVASTPEELRKGPRGGGRDRTKMLAHVLESEASYARTIGVRHPAPAVGDAAAVGSLRAAIIDVLRSGRPGAQGSGKSWPVRYAARRIAWHVLDHAWEMQDRTPG